MNWIDFGIGFGSGTLVGTVLASAAILPIWRRWVRRSVAVSASLRATSELEKRRVAYDLGLDQETPDGAGSPLRIADMYVTRPGALALYNQQHQPDTRIK